MIEAKELRRQKSAELSARASEIARFILFGVVALGYGLFSGDSTFAKNMMANHATMIRATMILAFAGIFLDFVQYNAGYRAADNAFANSSANYDYNRKSPSYWLWNKAFYLKQWVVMIVCGLVLALAVSIMFSASRARERPLAVQYVTFDKGETAVDAMHFAALHALAEAAKGDAVKLVVIEGRADGIGGVDQNLPFAEARARAVGQILREAGAPAAKLQLRSRVSAARAVIKPGASSRAVRIEVQFN